MDIKNVIPAYLASHLADSLKEGEPFNVTHSATHLYNYYRSPTQPSYPLNPFLYLISNMRDHLNCPAKEIASSGVSPARSSDRWNVERV